MFISNIEAVVTYDINEELQNKAKKKYTQKVNKSTSFNVIKNHAFEVLFVPDQDIDKVLEKIYQLLKTNKIAVRPNRKYERPSGTAGHNGRGIKSANHQKRKKKIVF